MATFAIHESDHSGWILVRPEGRVDSSTAPALADSLKAAIATGTRVAVDCSGVDYMSSAGLAALMEGARAARAAQKVLHVCAPTVRVRKVIEISQLLEFLDVKETLPC